MGVGARGRGGREERGRGRHSGLIFSLGFQQFRAEDAAVSLRRLVARAAAPARWVRGAGCGGTGLGVRRGKRPRDAPSAAGALRGCGERIAEGPELLCSASSK